MPGLDRLEAAVYTIGTDRPESDGTLAWDSTTMLVVQAYAGGQEGLGYSYTGTGAVDVVRDHLTPAVEGREALDVGAAWVAMARAVRNLGRPGIAGTAISAVDTALWDLKARLLGRPLVEVLDAVSDTAPIYGSGGFTSYPPDVLADQIAGWVEAGIPRVKIKVGRSPVDDEQRLAVARQAAGDGTELMVDANGAYARKQALGWAHRFADAGVRWLEEPVSSDDLTGLSTLRETGPGDLEITAGEYGYHLPYFQHMLAAGAVDCLQADVTRCGGYTAFRQVAALTAARSMDLSAHCAPQLSAHAGAAVRRFRHVEYFHDHVRIESMLFDGALAPEPSGVLRPDRSRPGHGLSLRHDDAERYRVR
jgi:L-alanine-DL-glutamate epimerase-like enolase superfamily enzyme